MSKRNYILCFKNDNDDYVIWDHETKFITTQKEFEIKRVNWFIMPTKYYEPSEKGLLKFAEDFQRSNKELLETINIWYSLHYNDFSAVLFTFFRLCGLEGDLKPSKFNGIEFSIPAFDKITKYEVEWFENTYNAGIVYFDGIKETIKTYGWDFKAYYPYLLGNSKLKIPKKQGKLKKYEALPNKLKYGIYKVLIVCNNPDFKKVFAFSKHNIYTHYCVNFAIHHKDLFNIDINLITDCEHNALVYNKSDLIYAREVFGNWYGEVKIMKEELKDNILVKPLSTQLWGTLIKKNTFMKTEQEIIDNKLDVGIKYHHDYRIVDEKDDKIELHNMNQPYTSNIRIKSFLTSFGRCMIGEIAINSGLEHIKRVHTDNITFTKKKKLNIENFYPEEKTTGLINWQSSTTHHKA